MEDLGDLMFWRVTFNLVSYDDWEFNRKPMFMDVYGLTSECHWRISRFHGNSKCLGYFPNDTYIPDATEFPIITEVFEWHDFWGDSWFTTWFKVVTFFLLTHLFKALLASVAFRIIFTDTVISIVSVRLPKPAQFQSVCLSVCPPSVRPFVRLFVRSFVRSFVRLFVRLFVCLFVCLFVRSFVRSLACLFACLLDL